MTFTPEGRRRGSRRPKDTPASLAEIRRVKSICGGVHVVHTVKALVSGRYTASKLFRFNEIAATPLGGGAAGLGAVRGANRGSFDGMESAALH
jgi:hypothetical protein